MKSAILLLVLAFASTAHAHKPSDGYLTLEVDEAGVGGHWDLALRDLDRALELDDGDGALTGRELRARADEVVRYAFARLALTRSGIACPVEAGALELVSHSDGRYARLPFRAACRGGAVALRYDFFFDLDPQHRAVVQQGEAAFVLDRANRSRVLAENAPTVLALIGNGMSHILSGLDHVLFLLALLLPSVLVTGRPLLGDVLKVVTAFTVAHSLTLALAALGVVNMSAALVEPAIAASVAIAALDNLWPVFGRGRASIAFALGLLHGFGFSSALSDLGLRGAALLEALLSFNVGVELGQLALIALFLPVAFALRNARAYEFVLVRGGSLAIAALALVWFAERVVGG
jgi:HupE / UreJ protein